MDDSNIRTHLQVAGWLNIVTNIGSILAVGMILFGGALLGATTQDTQGFFAFAGFAALLAIPIGIYGLLGLFAGIGMVQGKSWSRILGIIISLLHLINISSLGVTQVVGIYTLIVLFNPAAERALR